MSTILMSQFMCRPSKTACATLTESCSTLIILSDFNDSNSFYISVYSLFSIVLYAIVINVNVVISKRAIISA